MTHHETHYDLIIRGGEVFDGSGDAAFTADVAQVPVGKIAESFSAKVAI